MSRHTITGRTWRAPAILALLSLVGLLSALFADGIGDVVSWIALATPVAVSLRYMTRSR